MASHRIATNIFVRLQRPLATHLSDLAAPLCGATASGWNVVVAVAAIGAGAIAGNIARPRCSRCVAQRILKSAGGT